MGEVFFFKMGAGKEFQKREDKDFFIGKESL